MMLTNNSSRAQRHWKFYLQSLSTSSRQSSTSNDERWRRRRVVVTGLGAITPVGPDMISTWDAVLRSDNGSAINGRQASGNDGITSLEHALNLQNLAPDQYEKEWLLLQSLSCKVAASVNSDWIINHPKKRNGGNSHWNDGRTSRFVQMALIAAEEAILHSGLDTWLGNAPGQDESISTIDASQFQKRRESFGVSIGNGMSSTRDISMASATLAAQPDASKAHRKISPHFVPQILPNSPSARVAIHNNLLGPNLSHSEACAAGACAIAHGVELIQNARVSGMIVGGCESAVEALGLIGFGRLRALSSGDGDGEGQAQLVSRSSRPFDAKRDGFVLAEGAAMLVLEELEHAVSRGANILAEVVGVGYSGDGFHITAPEPMGEGAARAMQNAIRDAALTDEHQISGMENVDYINAHATSTPVGDVAEIRAIRLAMSQKEKSTKPLFVSSTKGVTGHLLGAAGAIEAALTVSAVADQIVPHTQNLSEISGDILQVIGNENHKDTNQSGSRGRRIHLVQNEPLHQEVNLAMSNSFGFGGTNASILFAKYNR